MKILVIGCGRVGSALAARYDREGHIVSVVDEIEEAFDHLGPGFKGSLIRGVALDIESLKKVGIEEAEVCVVATDGDNTNLVVAQIARERFEVPCVVVRVFDPNRAEFYASRGYNVVCPVTLAIEAMHGAIRDHGGEV